jgi:predicted ATPase/DNA-binding XRE family transcriptional regulator
MPSAQEPGSAVSTGGFGAALRAHRRRLGLTQQHLADSTGLGVRTLRDLETGRASRPQRATVDLLADALKLEGTDRSGFYAAAGAPAGRPPADTTPLPPAPHLVGRDADLRAVAGLLEMASVVTLVGLAGVGKTALALSLAALVADDFPCGVAGVRITDVSSEADVLAATAAVFGVPRASELPRRCQGAPALLLLDGADRAPAAAAGAVHWLRARVPQLRILATSRHPVAGPATVTWPVPPLEVPAPGAPGLTAPAALLFATRLAEARGRRLTPEEGPVAAELVRRLEGVPLALELAAARARTTPLPTLLARLADDAAPDSGGEALLGAVEASYRLLDPTERAALRRLSMLRGRWSLALADELLPDHPRVEGFVDRLVALGLATVRGSGELRFQLLGVVREFAAARCAAHGELADARLRHARVFAAVATRTRPELVGATLPAAVDRLGELASDLRAALEFAAEAEPETALRIAAGLPRWWKLRGQDREGREWLHRLLRERRTGGAEPVVRAWALLGVAVLAAEHGEGLAELPAAEAALAEFRRLGDTTGELAARSALCLLWQAVGGREESRRHAEAILGLARRTGRTREAAMAQNNLAWHDVRIGDLTSAAHRLGLMARQAARSGDARMRALARGNLAEVARLDGRYAEAVDLGRRAAADLVAVGDPNHRVRIMSTIGLAHAREGRFDAAESVIAELPDSEGSAGARALIGGYVRLGRGDRPGAAAAFREAADTLAGRHDARDVVEALVGATASCDDPQGRAASRAALAHVLELGGFRLLPRELELLGEEKTADR